MTFRMEHIHVPLDDWDGVNEFTHLRGTGLDNRQFLRVVFMVKDSWYY